MPTVQAQAAGLAASPDGRWLAWSEPNRLVLFDLERQTIVAEAAIDLEPPIELAISSTGRLLLLHAADGTTLVRLYTLPELRAVAAARLKGEARITVCDAFAMLLAGSDSLTAVDLSNARSAVVPARGPIQVVAQLTRDQVLVGARSKLEVWSVNERRPTHRLNLPLAPDIGFGGIVADGRMLWLASTAARGTLSLFRLQDGKQVASATVGGAIKAVVADPASTMLVAAVAPEVGTPLELVVFSSELESQRAVPFDRPIRAFCLAGAPADAIAIVSDQAQPIVVTLESRPRAATANTSGFVAADLAPSAAARDVDPEAGSAEQPANHSDGIVAYTDATPPSAPIASASGPSAEISDRLTAWRSQVHATISAAPPKPVPQADRNASTADEPRSRSRAELYAWGQAARTRSTTTPPPPPQGWRLVDLAMRFKLDTRSRTLLALLYSSWLDGDGERGLPIGVIARALGNDEDAWVEALAQGRIGGMGWLRTSRGRTRLRGVIGRFLDEAPPRITLVTPAEDAIASVSPPSAVAAWRRRHRRRRRA
jgi:hypothetical protein